MSNKTTAQATTLFGARGDYHAESDIAYDRLLETGMRIQPLPTWQDEWQHPEQYSNLYLIKNIQQDGVVL